jgi:hypothetical protein
MDGPALQQAFLDLGPDAVLATLPQKPADPTGATSIWRPSTRRCYKADLKRASAWADDKTIITIEDHGNLAWSTPALQLLLARDAGRIREGKSRGPDRAGRRQQPRRDGASTVIGSERGYPPVLAVVVPRSYKRWQKWIGPTLASRSAQTDADADVVFVDNGSTDDLGVDHDILYLTARAGASSTNRR